MFNAANHEQSEELKEEEKVDSFEQYLLSGLNSSASQKR